MNFNLKFVCDITARMQPCKTVISFEVSCTKVQRSWTAKNWGK